MNLPIAIELASLRQPLKAALQTAAKLGARGVELDARNDFRPQETSQTGLRQFRKLLEDLNLKISAINFPTRRGYDVAEDLEARITATKTAMKLARELGASVVINQVGRVPEDKNSQAWQTLIEALTALGAAGHHTGAFLAARTGSESGPDLLQLIKALPEGALGVDLDPGNLIINGFSATEAAQALGPYVLHVHADDAVRDLAIGRGLEVQIGRGSVDYPAIFGSLDEHNYRGWITITRRQSSQAIREIGEAISFLKSL